MSTGGTVELVKQSYYGVIRMNREENRLNREFVSQLNACMDEIEKDESIRCMILCSTGKYFSLGLDLGWLSGESPEVILEFQDVMFRLLWRIMTFPVVTIAAINGHAYAGGFFLALACDQRVMSNQKGWLCMNETRIGIPLSHPFYKEFIRTTLPTSQTYRDAAVLAQRFTPQEALKVGIVQAIVDPDDLVYGAKVQAGTALFQGELPRETLQQNKKALNLGVYEILTKTGAISKL